jgi:predicted aspartyl protease
VKKRVYGFTHKATGILRMLPVDVSIAPAFNPHTTKTQPTHKQYRAIWDTGATNSVITNKVINECNLKPIGMAEVHHAKGKGTSEVFLVNILLPNNVGVAEVRVTQGDLIGDFEILIGMDIISRGDFTVSNFNGNTCVSFRIPSVGHIDLRELTEKMAKKTVPILPLPKQSVGRNAPCPCGSGKKYKKCCGK